MILRQGFLLLLPLLLLKSTASHPGQKRDTSSVSISKSSQSVINDGNPVNSEPASFSPHTASPSYYHLKEVVGNAIKVHKSHSLRIISSMIVGSSISASPEHDKKIKEGEAPPDTTKSEAQKVNLPQYKSFIFHESNPKTIKVLDDGPMNSQADLDETSSAKSIKSSIKTMPTLAKRAIDFKLQKWNLKGWRGWNGRAGTSERTGGATQGIQRAQSMQKPEDNQGIQSGIKNRNKKLKNSIKINNGKNTGSRFRSGVRVGQVRKTGRKGSRVGQRNKDKVVKGNSPVALPAMISDKLTVTSASETEAGGRENSKHPIFESYDSQTEGYANNRKGRSNDRSNHPFGSSDSSDPQRKAISRTRNRGKNNRDPINLNFKTEDYYSSSDSGKTDSSSSSINPGSAKSVQYRQNKNIKTSTSDPRLLETKLVNSENKISPEYSSSTGDEELTGADPSANIHSIPTNIQDGAKIENNMDVTRFRDVQFMGHRDGFSHGENGQSDVEDEQMIGYNQQSNPRNFRRPHFEDEMDMHNYQMGGGGDNYGTNTGHKIAKAIGNFLPIAQTIGNVVTGRGNMGHGVGGYGYGGGYDDMDLMGGYGGGGGFGGYGGYGGYGGGAGMGGYGSRGYGGGGFGGGGYGASGLGGAGVGNLGVDELGGDDIGGEPVDDLLDETRTKAVEKSTPKTISNIKKTKNGSEVSNVATEKDHERDKKDTHHDRSSDHPSKKLKIDNKKKNDTITIDNDKTKNKISSQNNA